MAQLVTINVAQFVTIKMAKRGPVSNFTAYIYIFAVELKTGPRFGVSSVKNWSKSSVKTGPSFFFAVFFPVL